MTTASGFGAGPFGSLPFGSGLGTFAETVLISALAVRENLVRLRFSAPVYWSGVLDPGDASRRALYTFSVEAGSVDGRGVPARAVAAATAVLAPGSDGTLLDVWLDRTMSSYPARYVVAVSGLVDLATSAPIAELSVGFWAARRGAPSALPDHAVLSRDVANPQTLAALLDPLPIPSNAHLGRYAVDETGDLAFDEGLPSYEKRVLRRLSTRKGRYAHLPDYGMSIVDSVKQLARHSTLARLSAEAEEQVRLEPDTASVSVRVEVIGEMASLRIRATTTAGVALDIVAPVIVGG